MEHETFFTLLTNEAHWEFELFLIFIFDLLIGMLLWPFIKKHWEHHIERDNLGAVEKPFQQTLLYASNSFHEIVLLKIKHKNHLITYKLIHCKETLYGSNTSWDEELVEVFIKFNEAKKKFNALKKEYFD